MLHRVGTAIAATAIVLGWLALPAHAAGTTYTWVGNSQNASADNHSWTDARNWNPSGVPQDDDSVVIEQPDAGHCTASVDSVPTVTLTDFTLVQNPTLCGSSVHGGDITVAGTFSWDGGTLDTPTTVAVGATATVSGSNGKLNQLTQDLDIAGTLDLENAAASGALQVTAGRTVHVEPGAALNSTGNNDVTFTACCNTPAHVVNNGTMSVSGGTLTMTSVELDQRGVVDVASDGLLLTTGAPLTAADGASYVGAGRWAIEDHAKARMSGTQTLGSDFHLELGGLNVGADAVLGGTPTLAGSGSFDWTGGTIEAALTVDHGVHLNVSGVHTNNGQRQLYGLDYTASTAGDPVSVTNHGTITIDQGATIATAYAADLVNASDGTVSLAPGTTLSSGSCCTHPDTVANSGSVVVPATSDASPVVLDNVSYRATSGSRTSIAAGHEFQLSGGAPGRLSNTSIVGGGLLTVAAPTTAAGTVSVATSTRLSLTAPGRLDGTVTIGGAGRFSWTGGSVSGALDIATTGGNLVGGTATKYVTTVNGGSQPSTLTFATPTTFAAGSSATHDIVDLGTSTMRLSSQTRMSAFTEFRNGTIVNTGHLTVAPGNGARIDVTGGNGIRNSGSVTVDAGTWYVSAFRQTGGSTRLSSGSSIAGSTGGATAVITGGMLTGTGTIATSVSNTGGTVAPGVTGTPGTLRLSSSYTQGAGGTLVVDVSQGGHDLLAVTGDASMRGALVVHNLGTYRPTLGIVKTVLTAAALRWQVSCSTSSGAATTGGSAGHWSPRPGASRLVVVWRTGARTHC